MTEEMQDVMERLITIKEYMVSVDESLTELLEPYTACACWISNELVNAELSIDKIIEDIKELKVMA